VTQAGARIAGAAMAAFIVLSAGAGVWAAISATRRTERAREGEPRLANVPLVVAPATPIAGEAEPFRTLPTMLAIEPATPRQRSAHPRTRVTYRFIRDFPGAPPHIPHPLSADEFRTGTCKTCHERGGYSERFAAYVPLTPHAERGTCLQCHVGADAVLGTAAQDADPSTRCVLCHGAGGAPHPEAASTWPTSVWPAIAKVVAGDPPPPIPHGLAFRERCGTCHAGPAAVAEIRTTHPERTDCRTCHVLPDPDAAPFARPGGAP